MPSTDRRRGQRGVSLIESVVASALLGVGVVAGLTAWDTASMSATHAIRQAWANCIVRAQLDAVLAAPYAFSYTPAEPFSGDGTLTVTSPRVRGNNGTPDEEQLITVEARDPAARTRVVATATALKSRALEGGKPYDDTVRQLTGDLRMGCPAR
jgi:prepilin-type N-terminal cleavage/methylation domain-containing protein